MLSIISKLIRKSDYSLSDEEVQENASKIADDILQNNFDFSKAEKTVLTHRSKKRVVYCFNTLTTENILCAYLKDILDKNFGINYANRSKIMNTLFNTLPAIKDLNDFTIIRYDFKSFFNTVATSFIFEKYIENSSISRHNKFIFFELCNKFKYCYAGLNTSNAMTELACRDFDKIIRAKLESYGVVFFQRYVDDALIILNSYISKDEFNELINVTISNFFISCKVKLNTRKCSYISRRNLSLVQSFDFLGYNFTLHASADNKLKFEFGITPAKIIKYTSKIKRTFQDYKANGNIELLRHKIKLFSARIAYSVPLGNKRCDWITKGIIANYCELQYHLDEIDTQTKKFLKDVYFDVMKNLSISPIPYFFCKSSENTIYNLFSTMQRNRSIVFDEKIGYKINDLVKAIKKLKPEYSGVGKSYYAITMDYIKMQQG